MEGGSGFLSINDLLLDSLSLLCNGDHHYNVVKRIIWENMIMAQKSHLGRIFGKVRNAQGAKNAPTRLKKVLYL